MNPSVRIAKKKTKSGQDFGFYQFTVNATSLG